MIAASKELFEFDKVEDVISDIAKGRMVIVTDDADRENEGDLVMAAEKVTPEAVNFMATHGRGLICVPISNERAEQLGLQRMVMQNRESHRTDFTVSVDAARGVTTGISAYDRATTILAIASPKSAPEDLEPARPRLPTAGQGWRGIAPGRPHRSSRRPGPSGRTSAGRSSLRNFAR